MNTKNIIFDLGRSFVVSEDIRNLLENTFSGVDDWIPFLNHVRADAFEKVKKVEEVASRLSSLCDTLVIISSGATYLSVKAGIDLLVNDDSSNHPEILFAGWNSSGTFHKELLENLDSREFCICVMGKSNLSPEATYVFNVCKDKLTKKYGEAALSERSLIIHGDSNGELSAWAREFACQVLMYDEDISESHGILTPECLLPLSLCGIDISEILLGAYYPKDENAAEFVPMCCGDAGVTDIDLIPDVFTGALYYAICRSLMVSKNKSLEIFNHFDLRLSSLVEWLKYLYINSNTKIFPASLQFSNDLLGMGQFLQFGSPIFFETFLVIENTIPPADGENTENAALVKDLEQLNKTLLIGLMQSQRQSGLPILRIEIPSPAPFYFGQLLFFFTSAANLMKMLP